MTNRPGAGFALFAPLDIPEIVRGDSLATTIETALAHAGRRLHRHDIVVLCQKIVSKSEGRLVRLADVTASVRANELAQQTNKDPRLVELILSESQEIVRCARNVIIVRHRLGYVMANAGIDQSNVPGEESALLLPKDPDATASALRAALQEKYGVALGVVINDSFGRAWRKGTCGTAIGAAGFAALADMRGRPDRGGRVLRATEVGIADEIAAAASLLMGQGEEGRPIVVLSGLEDKYFSSPNRAHDLIRPLTEDLFR
jgi:coenzyme F420-0:L-glutamate ligase/coenzyme F420-1:gamma-L-glutamate ligase